MSMLATAPMLPARHANIKHYKHDVHAGPLRKVQHTLTAASCNHTTHVTEHAATPQAFNV